MVKAYMSIKLQDVQHYYLEDETIQCSINLRLVKVLKDPILRVSFKGRTSSYSNSTRHHIENIFTTEKEISITSYNTSHHLKKMIEIDFSVEVPHGVTIPSYRNLEGSDGGKVEYMIEANLESSGFLKRSIQATHIIQVPLVGKVNINEHGLERKRETSIRWPKHEQDVNTCILSAWIPHEGCIRGTDVPIRIEFKQPDRYAPVESVLVELVCQEIIASSKDSVPDMTRQLDDKPVQMEKKNIELIPEHGRLLGCNQVLVLPIPCNITPTIGVSAKVMRLDYKLRVTVKIPGIDSGKDKELSVNLPLVVGTTGIVDNKPFTQNTYPAYSFAASPANVFQMPEPRQMYPPQFVLNPQQMAYNSPLENESKFEIGMPMPGFEQEKSPGSVASNQPVFVYPPISTGYPPSDMQYGSPTGMYPPSRIDTPFMYPPFDTPATNEVLEDLELAINGMCTLPDNNDSLSASSSINRRQEITTDSEIENYDKPNVYTPATSLKVDVNCITSKQMYNSSYFDEPIDIYTMTDQSKIDTNQ